MTVWGLLLLLIVFGPLLYLGACVLFASLDAWLLSDLDDEHCDLTDWEEQHYDLEND